MFQQLRLMSRCNSSCRFCMVKEERTSSKDIPFESLKATIDKFDTKKVVDIFGGEPTLYPKFLELLEYLHESGFKISIATNARAFSNISLAKQIAQFRIHGIRSSLYGPNAEIHDWYTRTPGSFMETCQGIKNLSSCGIKQTINVLVMPRNMGSLKQIVNMIADLGASKVKFSACIDGQHNFEHLVGIADFRSAINISIEQSERSKLDWAIEKAPYCIASTHISRFTYERAFDLKDRVFDDSGTCRECILRKWCYGIDYNYAKRKGFLGISPISFEEIQARQINTFEDIIEFVPESFRLNIVSINSKALSDLSFCKELEKKIKEARGSLGSLCILTHKGDALIIVPHCVVKTPTS